MLFVQPPASEPPMIIAEPSVRRDAVAYQRGVAMRSFVASSTMSHLPLPQGVNMRML